MKQYPVSRDSWLYLAILASLTALAYWIWSWLIILPGILFLFVLVKQVAGYIARQIMRWVDKGYIETKGEGFCLTQFGLCAEIFVPTNVNILVSLGDKMRGGLNVVGKVRV